MNNDIKRRGKFTNIPELDSEFDNLIKQLNEKLKEIITKLETPVQPVNRVADGTYTVGIGGTQNGTITVKNGIITSIKEAVA